MFIASLRQEALADSTYPGTLDGYGPEHVNTLTNRCVVNADYHVATVDCDPSLLKKKQQDRSTAENQQPESGC